MNLAPRFSSSFSCSNVTFQNITRNSKVLPRLMLCRFLGLNVPNRFKYKGIGIRERKKKKEERDLYPSDSGAAVSSRGCLEIIVSIEMLF